MAGDGIPTAVIGEPAISVNTQCGINGGNDYPMTVGGLENPERARERDAKASPHVIRHLLFRMKWGLKWAWPRTKFNKP